MKVCVLYDSITGNTKLLADKVTEVFKDSLTTDPEAADLLFIGSWTDKGVCSNKIQTILKSLRNKQVFLFGTCGFGGSQSYFDQLFERTKTFLDPSNDVVGHFYCQGKMPNRVKERYLKLQKEHPEDSDVQVSLDNFEKAQHHPDQQDLAHFTTILESLIKKA